MAGIQNCTNDGADPQGGWGRGPNVEISHIALNDFFSGTDDQNLTKFGKKYRQVAVIQNCTNDQANPQGGWGRGQNGVIWSYRFKLLLLWIKLMELNQIWLEASPGG